MIYTNKYIDEEVNKALLTNRGNKYKMLIYSLICTLTAFIISLLLYSLDSTIVSELLPTLTGVNARSMFAVMSFLSPIVMIFTIFYLFANYKKLTFAEMHTNRMYMLIKLGEKVNKIIALRIFSAVAMPIILYIISFIISLFLSLIFGYSLNVTAMPGLFIIGIILISLTALTILVISLFIKHRKYGFALFILVAIGMFVFGILSNFTSVIQSSLNVSNLEIIFGNKTLYFLFICLGLLFLGTLLCFFIGGKRGKFYNTARDSASDIVILDYNTKEIKKVKKDTRKQKEKIFNATIYTVFGIFAIASFLTNILLIYMATNNLQSQSLYNNYVPVVFGSKTMQKGTLEENPNLSRPQFIEENDLIVFESMTSETNIEVGNIIYYINPENSQAIIEKVKVIDGDNYHIDVTYYPNEDDQGKLATTITKQQIKGVLVYVNRPLGAWITLNSSTIGKITFLIIPLIVIIFYDRFRRLFIAYRRVEENEYYSKLVSPNDRI